MRVPLKTSILAAFQEPLLRGVRAGLLLNPKLPHLEISLFHEKAEGDLEVFRQRQPAKPVRPGLKQRPGASAQPDYSSITGWPDEKSVAKSSFATASAGNQQDGEEGAIPLISRRIFVSESLPR